VSLHNPPADRQAHPGARKTLGATQPLKRFEQARQINLIEAHAVVGDTELPGRLGPLPSQMGRSSQEQGDAR